ncbi:MAG TPA: hypothetical protein PLU10_08875 [Chitinophagaceae bacterium]|nr:hypothetical protein [Chitinophagaceae bacterium]
MNYKLLFFLQFLAVMVNAQQFTHKAKVDNQLIQAKGFYALQLSPEIIAHSELSLHDIRLFNDKGKEIPFLVKRETEDKVNTAFHEFTILKNENGDKLQEIIIQNTPRKPLHQMAIEVRQADADRMISISGSNDRINWFVVRDKFSFSLPNQESGTKVIRSLQFPETDYAFYKIEIQKGNKEALYIDRIGYITDSITHPNYQEIAGIQYTRKDSAKKTILHFTCTPGNRIDFLEFITKSPERFLRKATLTLTTIAQEKQYSVNKSYPKSRNFESTAQNFELNSAWPHMMDVSSILAQQHSTEFTIEIENDDNEPIQFSAIKAYQLNTQLIAELKPTETYFLYVGDTNLDAPVYDLVYFEHQIKAELPTIHLGKLQLKSTVMAQEFTNKNDKKFVWIGLSIVGIILLLLSGQMLKTLQKEKYKPSE